MNRHFIRAGLAGIAAAATMAVAAPAHAATGPSPASADSVQLKASYSQDLGTWSNGKRSTHNRHASLNAQTCIRADVVNRGNGYKFSLRAAGSHASVWSSGKFYDSHASLCSPWTYHEGDVYTRVETTGTLHAKVWIYTN
ncbi:hypothetical protein [Amycolatopsis sp. NPDC021455]|uniref:hypothetical protein n=1 Tax=Amycolatopsis sp. NPDC021455 TaxID=3154901 RepID=UPI0033D5F58A